MIIADFMVVAYLRVSTGKQNLANQQDEIRRFAAARGIVVDRWVTEVVSGRKNEKERKLGPLLGKMRSGDTLIVTELSRLSRTLTDIMAIMGRCLERRIVLYSIKEGYAFDDSINSKVLCFAFGAGGRDRTEPDLDANERGAGPVSGRGRETRPSQRELHEIADTDR